MTASLASLTVPVTVPRASCATAVAGASNAIAAKTATIIAYNENFDAAGFIIIPPSWSVENNATAALCSGFAVQEMFGDFRRFPAKRRLIQLFVVFFIFTQRLNISPADNADSQLDAI
jgi:hypothetical protein